MDVQAYLYDAEGRDREVPLDEVAVDQLGPDALLWIDIPDRDPASLKRVSTALGVPEEIWTTGPTVRSQLENYRDYFRFSVRTAPNPQSGEHEAKEESSQPHPEDTEVPGSVRLDFIVSERWLVTVHSGPVACLQGFRDQDKADTSIGMLSGQALSAFCSLGTCGNISTSFADRVIRRPARRSRAARNCGDLARSVGALRSAFQAGSLMVAQREVFTDCRARFCSGNRVWRGHFTRLAGRFEGRYEASGRVSRRRKLRIVHPRTGSRP